MVIISIELSFHESKMVSSIEKKRLNIDIYSTAGDQNPVTMFNFIDTNS